MTAQIIETIRRGSCYDMLIVGLTQDDPDFRFETGQPNAAGAYRIRAGNKGELAYVEQYVASINNRPAAAARAAAAQGRYIERLEAAEMMGLNHGRSWIADGYNVDRHGIDPSWEGEAICYVYPA